MVTDEERRVNRLKACLVELNNLAEREIVNTGNFLWIMECFRTLDSRDYCITRGYGGSYAITPSRSVTTRFQADLEDVFSNKENWHRGEYMVRSFADKLEECSISCRGILKYLENKEKDDKKAQEDALKERISLEEDIRYRFRRY